MRWKVLVWPVLAQETVVSAGLNGDSKVTESLTTSCAYDHLWVGCRLDFATYSLFWLGMASNSKTGGGDPVSVRL